MPLDNVAGRFAAGWVVTDGDRPLFGTDPDRPGIVTPLLPDRRTAVSLAAIVADGDQAWEGRLGVSPLGDPWGAMRAFAARGVVGWSPQGRWDGGAPPRVRFAVRRHEVGAPLPTVIDLDEVETGVDDRRAHRVGVGRHVLRRDGEPEVVPGLPPEDRRTGPTPDPHRRPGRRR